MPAKLTSNHAITRQKKAKLRVCASCQWIFEGADACPKCDFGHYGARFVFGNKAYRYAETQQPWFEQKMADYANSLRKEITDSNSEMGKPKPTAATKP